ELADGRPTSKEVVVRKQHHLFRRGDLTEIERASTHRVGTERLSQLLDGALRYNQTRTPRHDGGHEGSVRLLESDLYRVIVKRAYAFDLRQVRMERGRLVGHLPGVAEDDVLRR